LRLMQGETRAKTKALGRFVMPIPYTKYIRRV
jgi:hypothetical protein